MSSQEYTKGPCVLGKNCKCSNMELRPEHSCPDCGKIVHVLCGSFDKTRDKYICGCLTKEDVTVKEIAISASEQLAMVSTITQTTNESEAKYREIPRDYFIGKDQKINKKSKEDGGGKIS